LYFETLTAFPAALDVVDGLTAVAYHLPDDEVDRYLSVVDGVGYVIPIVRALVALLRRPA
jgi:hypothetical protein